MTAYKLTTQDTRSFAMSPLNLPELAEWASASHNKKFDAKSFIVNNVTVAEGVALSMTMWPEFTE